MKYQFIMQLPEELYGDLDWIANLEDRLEGAILNAEVDGHDIGRGELNIFIHTDTPFDTFEIAKNVLEEVGVELEKLKAAYREIGDNHYIPLWPEKLVDFKVI